jgi:hypothetical protein
MSQWDKPPIDPVWMLAYEMIDVSLKDLVKKKRQFRWEYKSLSTSAMDALQWFNERATTPGGYGWCLSITHINPNIVRGEINKILSTNKRTTVSTPRGER